MKVTLRKQRLTMTQIKAVTVVRGQGRDGKGTDPCGPGRLGHSLLCGHRKNMEKRKEFLGR